MGERSDALMPADHRGRSEATEWLFAVNSPALHRGSFPARRDGKWNWYRAIAAALDVHMDEVACRTWKVIVVTVQRDRRQQGSDSLWNRHRLIAAALDLDVREVANGGRQ